MGIKFQCPKCGNSNNPESEFCMECGAELVSEAVEPQKPANTASLRSVRTAEDMYDYCVKNNFGTGFSKGWGIKHFSVIERCLRADEKVLMTFIGMHNYISMTKHDGNCAYAITNRRILIGQKKLIGEFSKSIMLDMLNDVTLDTGILRGCLIFDTIKEIFKVQVLATEALNISEKAHEVVFSAKNGSITDEAMLEIENNNSESETAHAQEDNKSKATNSKNDPTPKQWVIGCTTIIILMAILGGCIKSCLSKNSTNKAQDTISANQKAQTEIPKKTDDEKKKEWRAKIDKWEKHFRKLREEIGIGKVTFLIDSVSFCDMPPQTVNQSKVKTGKTYLSFKVVAYNKSDKKACLLFSVYDHEKDKYSTIYLNLAASNPFPVFLKPDQKTFGDITTEVDKNKKYSIVLLDGENEQLFMINIPEAAYNENNKSK